MVVILSKHGATMCHPHWISGLACGATLNTDPLQMYLLAHCDFRLSRSSVQGHHDRKLKLNLDTVPTEFPERSHRVPPSLDHESSSR